MGVSPMSSITLSTTSIGGPGSAIGHTSTPSIGATALSVNRTVGRPAWCTCCAMARLAAGSPVTPTSRGMLTRSSAMREGEVVPVGMCTTRVARAERMCGAGAAPDDQEHVDVGRRHDPMLLSAASRPILHSAPPPGHRSSGRPTLPVP